MHSPSEPSVTSLARVDCDRPTAARLAEALAEAHEDAAVAAFERPDGSWSVEAHFLQVPHEPGLRDLVRTVAGAAVAQTLVVETVAARDWVAASLAGLKPVAAGRFLVHGAHDRARVGAHRIGVEIEAALAFGTGHHGTTRGCLLALDGWLKRGGVRGDTHRVVGWAKRSVPTTKSAWARRCAPLPTLRRGSKKPRILDVGTGTGVLAIAAAKALCVGVVASDIDRDAVAVARANARANGVGPLVEVVHAGGLAARRLRARGPYDLVLANILLAPLKRFAAPIAQLLAPGARVILSGLLATQAPAAIATYRAQGLALVARIPLDEWVTLVLRRHE
jgi:ribosomal protein L11 methyltransferase